MLLHHSRVGYVIVQELWSLSLLPFCFRFDSSRSARKLCKDLSPLVKAETPKCFRAPPSSDQTCGSRARHLAQTLLLHPLRLNIWWVEVAVEKQEILGETPAGVDKNVPGGQGRWGGSGRYKDWHDELCMPLRLTVEQHYGWCTEENKGIMANGLKVHMQQLQKRWISCTCLVYMCTLGLILYSWI